MWKNVFVVFEQPVDQQIGSDIPELGVTFAAAEVVFVAIWALLSQTLIHIH